MSKLGTPSSVGPFAANSQVEVVPSQVEKIGEELQRVLNSSMFRGSKRCHDFLEFVVTKAVEGNAKNLKERTLAIEVFGRNEHEDLSDVSVVRVGAREVRKRLAQYYISEGASNEIRIELPSGSYVPLFQSQSAPVLIHTETLNFVSESTDSHQADINKIPPNSPERQTARPRFSPVYIAWATGALVIGLAVTLFKIFVFPPTPFDEFWRPDFNQKQTVEVLMAHPIAYHPSSRARHLDRQINGPQASFNQPVQVPPELLNGADFVPVRDLYVGFGDAVAAIRLTTLFSQHKVNSQVRLADHVVFSDLVGANSVLIGSMTNRWTGELTKGLRYQFAWRDNPIIRDSLSGKEWVLGGKQDSGGSTEDYIIVSRLPHLKTNGFVVVCAGLNYYGTEEAGRILSEPELLNPILRKLPQGWASRNLQLVLHIEVIGDAPALPEMVASYSQ